MIRKHFIIMVDWPIKRKGLLQAKEHRHWTEEEGKSVMDGQIQVRGLDIT